MQIINDIVPLLLALDILVIAVCLVIAIIFYFISRGEADPTKKVSDKKFIKRIILWPIMIGIILIVLFGISAFLTMPH